MIRVLIVTPVRLLGDLIENVCSAQPDLQVVGTVEQKQEALQRCKTCDVIVASAALPDNGALELIQNLNGRPQAPGVIVIGLPKAEPLLIRYLEAGAAGCICEQDSTDELVRAIRSSAARQIALSQELFGAVLKRVNTLADECLLRAPKNGATGSRANAASLWLEKGLTRREREILQLIAQGYGNREIAQHLTIELGTTKNHVHNILDKLNVKSRRDAAVYFSLGLV
jgi:two-component system, NarL family, nitrate/nitrite response regulator NarL